MLRVAGLAQALIRTAPSAAGSPAAAEGAAHRRTPAAPAKVAMVRLRAFWTVAATTARPSDVEGHEFAVGEPVEARGQRSAVGTIIPISIQSPSSVSTGRSSGAPRTSSESQVGP
jgi:hypothetical protein